MGGIFFDVGAYTGTLSELAGYKAGLAVSRDRIRRLLRSDKGTKHPWPTPGSGIHMRSEVFEASVRWLLFKLGAVKSPDEFAYLAWLMKLRQDPATAAIADDLVQWNIECVQNAALERPGEPIDLTPMFRKAAQKYGMQGLQLAKDFYEQVVDHVQGAAFSVFSIRTWDDVVDLEALFRSPDAPPSNGAFFEQRFIDYLAANLNEIGRMYWRQLERLTAEFFKREGYEVELGPGANDDGVDVRVWRDAAEAPTVIIQCKRQKAAVPKVVVKSLWADVQHEKAESGLIVTTSRLEPGAKGVIRARQYPIATAERAKLRKWVQQMRTARAGGFIEPEQAAALLGRSG